MSGIHPAESRCSLEQRANDVAPTLVQDHGTIEVGRNVEALRNSTSENTLVRLGAGWQQWQRLAFVRVRSGVRSPKDCAQPCALREQQRTGTNAAQSRQAEGHWFEPSTAHLDPRSHHEKRMVARVRSDTQDADARAVRSLAASRAALPAARVTFGRDARMLAIAACAIALQPFAALVAVAVVSAAEAALRVERALRSARA